MPGLKNISANLLLVLAGLAVSLFVLEAGLRIFEPFKMRVRGDEIVLPSNISYVTTNRFADKLDETITHTRNSLGFRGDDPPDNLDGALSIIAIGGSTTESRFQSDDREWVYLLGRRLERHFPLLWINNAGLDGHSTFGHRILLKDLVAPIRPKITLFMVGINDVGRSGLIINEKKYRDRIQTESPALFLLSLANRSEVLTLAINFIRYLKAKGAGLTHDTQLDLAQESGNTMVISNDERARIIEEHKNTYIPDYATRIDNMLQEARAAGSMPVLITQPVLYGPVRDPVTGTDLGALRVTHDMNGTLGWSILEMYNDVLRTVAKRDDLLLIDLAGTMEKSSALFYDYVHYTNLGAEHVAMHTFDALCPWLGDRYPEYFTGSCESTGNE